MRRVRQAGLYQPPPPVDPITSRAYLQDPDYTNDFKRDTGD